MATIERPPAERRFEHLLLEFLSYLEFERGLSRNTLEAYRGDLLQYGRFLESRELSALDAAPGRRRRLLGESRPRQRGAATGLRRHGAPQVRVPALVLSPPAPGRAARNRPDRHAECPAASAQAAARADPGRRRAAAGPASRHRAGRAARPRPAGGDVRLRPSGLGGDRARAGRRGPRGAGGARAREGLEGAIRALRAGRSGCAADLPRARAARAGQAIAGDALCS